MESIFVLIDRDQKVAYVNNAGCEVLEAEFNHVLGKNWFDNFLPKDVRQDILSVFEALLSGELAEIDTFTNPVLTTKGNEVNVRWDNSLVKRKDGTVVGSFSLGKEERIPEDSGTFITICSYCKQIRGSEDQWDTFENYFAEKYRLLFSHGMCLACFKKEIRKT